LTSLAALLIGVLLPVMPIWLGDSIGRPRWACGG
jgi:hypothetical protein